MAFVNMGKGKYKPLTAIAVNAKTESGDVVTVPVNRLMGVLDYSRQKGIDRKTTAAHIDNGTISSLIVGDKRFVLKDPSAKYPNK